MAFFGRKAATKNVVCLRQFNLGLLLMLICCRSLLLLLVLYRCFSFVCS